LQVSKDRKTGR